MEDWHNSNSYNNYLSKSPFPITSIKPVAGSQPSSLARGQASQGAGEGSIPSRCVVGSGGEDCKQFSKTYQINNFGKNFLIRALAEREITWKMGVKRCCCKLTARKQVSV